MSGEEDEQHPWGGAPPKQGDVLHDLEMHTGHTDLIAPPLAGEIVFQLYSRRLIQWRRLVQAK
jgi:hypothetical protein